VSMGGGASGGASSSDNQRAQDLADLFELNREKLRNQYESVQRGREQQQAADQQIDETAERLKRLSARLEQENERAQRKADSLAQKMGASGSSGGASQRQMAQEAEEAARQLERLAREKAEQQRQEAASSQSNSSSGSASSKSQSQSSSGGAQSQREQRALEEAARRLRDAADAMRRSASGSRSSQQSAADAANAASQLEEARRLLDQQRSGRLERDVQDVLQGAKELSRKEQEVGAGVSKLWDNPNPQERAQQLQSLTDQKGEMANELRDLKARMDRLSLDSRRENKDAATGLADASKTMRDRKTEEKIRASQGAMRYSGPEYTKSLESSIGSDLNELQQRLEQVAAAARNGAGKQNEQTGQAQALDKTRDLVRGMQSLDERMRNAQSGKNQGQNQQGAGQQSPQGQNGQQAQNGRQGQPNGQQGQQNGKQGQNGQQGQSGQQGAQGQQPGQPGGEAPGGMRGGQNGGGRPSPENSAAGGPPEGQSLGQFGREMRERLSDAQALRRELQRQQLDTRELDRAIAGMQSLSNDRLLSDERTAAELRAQTLEHLKAFEFALRKKLGDSDENRVLLGRAGDVPAAFKQYVEEYYRSLAKKP
jgi:hypothetical protein